MIRSLLLIVAGLVPGLLSAQSVKFEVTFGGSGSDTVFAVLAHEGFSYVAGRTTSADFPVTDGSTYRGDAGEIGDIFVAKLDDQGQIMSATLLGGSGSDFANGLVMTDGPGVPDGSGGETFPKILTISGWTDSTDFQTLNPIQAANGGKTDAVIAQFDLNLNLLFSTYLGGAEDDQFSGLTPVVNNVGDDDLMFFGFTTSTDFPFPTPNAADPSTTVKNLADNADGLLVRMNRNRTIPMASLLRRASSGNGTQNEVILAGTSGLTIPGSGFSPAQYGLYVTGWTDNDFFRHSSDPTGAGRRIFLTEINPETGGRIYSRVLGGSGDDIGQAVAITAHGVVVLGQTTSTDLPNARSLFQASPGGGTDAVLVGWQHLPSDLPLFARPAYVAYLGGSGDDSGRALAAAFGPRFPQSALAEHLHISGVTGSANLPLLPTPQQPPAQATYGGGATDGFFGRLATVPNPESTGPAFLFEAKNLTFDGGSDDDAFTSVAAVLDDGTDFEGVAGGAVQVVVAEARGQIRQATRKRERAKVTSYGRASSRAVDLTVVAQPRAALTPGSEEVLVLVITNMGTIEARSIVLGVNPDQVIGVGPTAEVLRGTVIGQPDGLLNRDANGRFLLGDLTLEPFTAIQVEVTVKSLPAALDSQPPAVGLSIEVFDRGGLIEDENPADNSIRVDLPVDVPADVFVERTLVLLDPVTANPRQVRYEFRVSNVGTRAADLVQILLTGVNLKNVTYMLRSESLNVGQLDDPDPVQVSVGKLEAGASVVLVVVGELLRPSEGTRLTARGTAADESNTENNTAIGETVATPLPDLTILMQSRPPLPHGQEEVLTLVITNQGTGPASTILLTIRPNTFDDKGEPRDITADIVRITFNGASLSQVPGQLPHTVSLGELVLAPGGSLQIDVALKSRPEALTLSPPAVHLSTVVDSREIDADETNNLRRFAVPVEVPTSDWDLGFDLPSDPVPVGTPFRVIVRVGNLGPAAGNPVVKLFFDPNLGVTAPPACEPVSPDEAWLINAFRELYGRPPTRQELAEALPIIQTTGNRQATGQALLGSAEHHGFIVRQLHLALRGTPPTEAEQASAVLRLQAGAQLGVLAFEILSALPATPAEVVRTVESAKAYLDGSLETIERQSFDVVTQPDFNLEDYLRDSVTPALINLWVPGKTLEELIAPTDPQAVIYLCELDELPAGGQVELPFDLTPHYPGDYVVDGEVTSGQADPTPGNNRVTEGIEVAGPQDFGDAPAVALAEPGFPPVPGGYPTLTAANGARHGVDPRLGLGLLTDAEMDGQPDNFSLGDDFLPAAPDDEDGVIFLTPVVPLFFGIVAADLGEAGNVVQVLVRARVPADKSAQLRAWVDFNRDGDWNDAGEQVIANQVVKAGVTQFGFRLPAITSRGFSHARFRLSTAGNPLPSGPALDGEVEDHFVLLGGLDRGDAPVLYGAAPHLQPLLPMNFLGTRVDPDPVQPSLDARADDTDVDGDDEDGVAAVGPFFAGVDTSLVVTASQAGFVNLWIDYNGVNGFEEFPALPDPTEYVNASIMGLPMGVPPAPFPVVAGPNVIRFRVPDRLKSGLSFLRVRYTSQAIPNLGPINLAPDGEVEDYRVQLFSLMPDFGDAPDSLETPQYPTLRANDGAFHLVTEDRFHLGQRVDIEPDGFPSLDALGDDEDNGLENPANPEPDDEDGVRFSGLWTPGQMATVELTVTAGNPGPAFVNAWVDFNLDFDWADAGEHVLVNTPVVDGLNLLSLNVPANARPGITYARFRLTRDEGTRFNGPATSGEVEDYVVIVDSVANGLQFDSFTQSNNELELRWSGNAVLESAPTVQGPWTRVQGATSPFRRVIGPETVIFYRLVRP